MDSRQTLSKRMGPWKSCSGLGPHRQADHVLVKHVAPKARVHRQGRAVDAAAASAQEEEGRVGHLLRLEVALPEGQLLCKEVALEVAGDACRGARFQRAGTDNVEPDV